MVWGVDKMAGQMNTGAVQRRGDAPPASWRAHGWHCMQHAAGQLLMFLSLNQASLARAPALTPASTSTSNATSLATTNATSTAPGAAAPLTLITEPRALQAAAQTQVRDVAIRWQCDSHAGELLCNRDTLVGAVLNLIENAIQASAGQARLKVHLYTRADTLRLCVSDDGPGMPPQTLKRLGEPFFTTKATGTGLGLSVVKAVARAHQGELMLRSTLGRGTCAMLTLPLIALQEPVA